MRDMNRLTVNAESYRIRDEQAVSFELQSLTAEQMAQARANIGAAGAEAMGDVDAALDGILAIQNALIGGDGL